MKARDTLGERDLTGALCLPIVPLLLEVFPGTTTNRQPLLRASGFICRTSFLGWGV